MFTCPGCGYRTFSGPPGSYEICGRCGWEDDELQLLDPWYAGGANRPSLAEWQEWHAAFVESETIDEGTESNAEVAEPDYLQDVRWRRANDSDRVRVRRVRDIREIGGQAHLAQWYYWLRDEA